MRVGLPRLHAEAPPLLPAARAKGACAAPRWPLAAAVAVAWQPLATSGPLPLHAVRCALHAVRFALCTQDQYLPSPASLSMLLLSNGFPTLPTHQTASAKIRPVYRYVQYSLLLSRTLLEVLGCSYYLLGCDFNDSASRST